MCACERHDVCAWCGCVKHLIVLSSSLPSAIQVMVPLQGLE